MIVPQESLDDLTQ